MLILEKIKLNISPAHGKIIPCFGPSVTFDIVNTAIVLMDMHLADHIRDLGYLENAIFWACTRQMTEAGVSSSVAAEEEFVLAIEKKGALQLMIVLNTSEIISVRGITLKNSFFLS